MHIHDLAAYAHIKFNVTHIINRLSFGEDFPGIVNPLDGVVKVLDDDCMFDFCTLHDCHSLYICYDS
jgi:hypothetical protein